MKLLAISRISTAIPTTRPEDLQAFVAPGLPSPTSLTLLPEIDLTAKTAQGIDPLINPIRIHSNVIKICSLEARDEPPSLVRQNLESLRRSTGTTRHRQH